MEITRIAVAMIVLFQKLSKEAETQLIKEGLQKVCMRRQVSFIANKNNQNTDNTDITFAIKPVDGFASRGDIVMVVTRRGSHGYHRHYSHASGKSSSSTKRERKHGTNNHTRSNSSGYIYRNNNNNNNNNDSNNNKNSDNTSKVNDTNGTNTSFDNGGNDKSSNSGANNKNSLIPYVTPSHSSHSVQHFHGHSAGVGVRIESVARGHRHIACHGCVSSFLLNRQKTMENKTFYDVAFVVHNTANDEKEMQEFPALRATYAAQSAVFEGMLYGKMIQSKRKAIEIDYMNPCVFEHMDDSFYAKNFQLTHDHVIAIRVYFAGEGFLTSQLGRQNVDFIESISNVNERFVIMFQLIKVVRHYSKCDERLRLGLIDNCHWVQHKGRQILSNDALYNVVDRLWLTRLFNSAAQ